MAMHKIMNAPEQYVDDALKGILSAYKSELKALDGDQRVIVRAGEKRPGKVGVVTAGGSGHLPLFLGYVGEGMLDGCTVGNIFASPSAERMSKMICACDAGAGVLCVYGNYGGDVMNLGMARDMVDFEGIKTAAVLGRDDVASSPKETAEKRRGVAGIVFAYKVAGAAADLGMDLEEVTRVTQKALDNTRSMGVALTPCIQPEIGRATFTIAENEIEIGMGIHGEPGIETAKNMSACDIVKCIYKRLTADMPLQSGDEISVIINGLGATPLEELLITYGNLHEQLEHDNVSVFMPHIGEYATSMDMAGMSISILKLDEELKQLLSHPAHTPFYTPPRP